VGTGRFIRKLRGHDSTINAVTHAANDDVLVTAGYDQCVKLWDMKSRSTEALQVMKAFRVSCFASLLRCLDTAYPHAVNRMHSSDCTVACMQAHDIAMQVVSWPHLPAPTPDRACCCSCSCSLAPQDSVTSVLVHGWEIIAGSVDGTVRRFDVRMGRAYTDEVHHPVTSVAASHDGLCVLAACLDSTLRLLDKSTGELLSTYTGHVHSSVKMDCCLTPTDAHVVGCSETGAAACYRLNYLSMQVAC
jgi:mitogen-activated protein kinase organizer 1